MSNRSFGQWVKQRRKALDLTQGELAQQTGCALVTISRFETNLRRPSRETAERLAHILQIPADERDTFMRLARGSLHTEQPAQQPVIAEHQPTQALSSHPPTPLTAIYGRERELAEARSIMFTKGMRLLTLVGPPGVGKTRLALQLAADLQRSFVHGVCFVALAKVRDPDLVSQAIAHELGIKFDSQQPVLLQLQQALRDRQFLLVLDNFEHLISATVLVSELLATVPNVTVLATSRGALRISGEHILSIPPLATPDMSSDIDIAELSQIPSVTLFTQRVSAVNRAFSLTTANAIAVSEICRRLDGLPLAIELGAARCRVLSPQYLLSQLNSRLPILTRGAHDLALHQRTLRDTLTWSYELLDSNAQVLLRRLSVFIGEWSLTIAEAVCQTPDDLVSPTGSLAILDGLAALTDQSLILHTTGAASEPLFVMLEIIREFAGELLVAAGEDTLLHYQHAQYYVGLAEAAEPELVKGQQAEWMAKLDQHLPNLRIALQWLLEHQHIEAAARLTKGTFRFWETRHPHEGRSWVAKILDEDANLPAVLHAEVLNVATGLAHSQGDIAAARSYNQMALELRLMIGDADGIAVARMNCGRIAVLAGELNEAHTHYTEALALARSIGNTKRIAGMLTLLADAEFQLQHFAEARALGTEALTLQRSMGDTRTIAATIANLGVLALYEGDNQAAYALMQEALPLFRELGEVLFAAQLLRHLGHIAIRCGEYAQAYELIREGLVIHWQERDREGTIESFDRLGLLACSQQNYVRATRLYAAMEAWRERTGIAMAAIDLDMYRTNLATLHAQTDPDAFAAAWAEGQAFTLQQAVEYALNDAAPSFPPSMF